MRLKKCLELLAELSWYGMRSVSRQTAVNSRHVHVARRRKRLCQIHEAEYVKRRSCRAHWTEAGCRHSDGRAEERYDETVYIKRTSILYFTQSCTSIAGLLDVIVVSFKIDINRPILHVLHIYAHAPFTSITTQHFRRAVDRVK